MTKQNDGSKNLFKPEVYQAMEKELESPSKYRGSEEALDMIAADRQLQDFFRAYAKKEDIIESSPFCFTKAGRDRKITLIDNPESERDENAGLYIGPRQEEDALLFVYTHNVLLQPIGSGCGRYSGELVKQKGIWKIKVPDYKGRLYDDGPYETYFKVSQSPFFNNLSKQDILGGLEKAIKKITNLGKKP